MEQFSSRSDSTAIPLSRKTLTTSKLAKGELADRTSELPSLSVPFQQEAGGRAPSSRHFQRDLCGVCASTCLSISHLSPIPAVGGKEEARKGQTEESGLRGEGKTRECASWCGFGETPGDRHPTVINFVRENRFSLPATKSAELTMKQSVLCPGSSGSVTRQSMSLTNKGVIVGAWSCSGEGATLRWQTDSSWSSPSSVCGTQEPGAARVPVDTEARPGLSRRMSAWYLCAGRVHQTQPLQEG